MKPPDKSWLSALMSAVGQTKIFREGVFYKKTASPHAHPHGGFMPFQEASSGQERAL